MSETWAIFALLALIFGTLTVIVYVLPAFWPVTVAVFVAYSIGRRVKRR